jgi:K+-sensing histidine kinase KdpD
LLAERNATRIVVGHADRSRWPELFLGSLVHRLLRALPDVAVSVAAGADRPDDRRR